MTYAAQINKFAPPGPPKPTRSGALVERVEKPDMAVYQKMKDKLGLTEAEEAAWRTATDIQAALASNLSTVRSSANSLGAIYGALFKKDSEETKPLETKEVIEGSDEEIVVSRLEDSAAKINIESIENREGLSALMDFVMVGESFGGSPDTANRGTIGDRIIGSTRSAVRNGKRLSELTIGEIKELQKIKNPNNPDRLFAVGLFQMIPKTFLETQKATGVSDDEVFNRETQEKMGRYLFDGKANTRKTMAWLRGKEGVSINDAILGLAREFASVPVPYDVKRNGKIIKAGNTYYSNTGNKAQYTVDEVKSVLNKVKDAMRGE